MLDEERKTTRVRAGTIVATVKNLPKGFEKQIIELEYVLERLSSGNLSVSQSAHLSS